MKIKLFKALTLIMLFLISGAGFAQVPNLGSAASFNLFTTVGALGNTGVSIMNGGAVGTNCGAITGFGGVNCVQQIANSVTAQCATDLAAAYNQIHSMTVTQTLTAASLPLGGTYYAGVYLIPTAVTLAPTLTLDGQGHPDALFIFNVTGALTTAADTKMILTNGASAQNVFWNVDGAICLGAAASEKGIFISLAGAIHMGAGVIIEGSALTIAGAINIDNCTISNCLMPQVPTVTLTQPTCLVSNGEIAVTAPAGSGYTYSINGFATSNSTGLFPSLSPGTYTVSVKNGNGYISHINVILIDFIHPPNLKTLTDFILFTSTGALVNTSVSVIEGGAVGTNCGSITGYTGVNCVQHIQDAASAQCMLDLEAVVAEMLTIPITHELAEIDLPIGGTYTTGVYHCFMAASLTNSLSLDAQGDPGAIFIFKITGALTFAASARVILTNGAQVSNVFWIVDGAVGADAGALLKGTFLVQAGAIALGAGVQVEGRMLTKTGAITTNSNTLAARPVPEKPTVSVIQTTAAVATGTITITAPTGTGMKYSIDGCTYTNTTGIFVLVPIGVYTVTARNLDGCSIGTSVTINTQPVTTVWSGSVSNSDWNVAGNWVPHGVPTAGLNVNIPDVSPNSGPTIYQPANSPALCFDLTIASGTSVTIAAAKALTVYGTLTNNSGTGGLIIQSDGNGTGSLIHNSDAVNATLQRYITGSSTLTNMKYHFVSVPLVTATASTSNMFLNSYLFDYTQASGTWNALGSATTNTLDETRGYMIYYPGTSNTYSFAGQLNNGAFTALTSYTSGQGYNLVPNPYPSAIDWDASSGWTKTNIAGTLYYWPAGAAAVSSNYTYWNGSAGVNSGTRYVPAGQAFFVQATGSSPVLTMTNATRVHNAQAFWKEGERIQNLLRIKAVSIHNQAFDELLIHFREGATANFDSDFEANKLQGGEDAPQISSVAMDNSKLSINSLPFSGSDVIVPLAFGLNAGTDVTLTASGMESFYESIPIYLEDLTTNTVTDLRVNPVYTFSHAAGDNENRFQLRFKGVTGTPEQPFTSPGNVFVSQGQLFVDVPSMQQLPASLAVYDALGRQFSSFKVILNGIMQYAAPSIPGVYVVRIIGGNKSFTGKVVVGE